MIVVMASAVLRAARRSAASLFERVGVWIGGWGLDDEKDGEEVRGDAGVGRVTHYICFDFMLS